MTALLAAFFVIVVNGASNKPRHVLAESVARFFDTFSPSISPTASSSSSPVSAASAVQPEYPTRKELVVGYAADVNEAELARIMFELQRVASSVNLETIVLRAKSAASGRSPNQEDLTFSLDGDLAMLKSVCKSLPKRIPELQSECHLVLSLLEGDLELMDRLEGLQTPLNSLSEALSSYMTDSKLGFPQLALKAAASSVKPVIESCKKSGSHDLIGRLTDALQGIKERSLSHPNEFPALRELRIRPMKRHVQDFLSSFRQLYLQPAISRGYDDDMYIAMQRLHARATALVTTMQNKKLKARHAKATMGLTVAEEGFNAVKDLIAFEAFRYLPVIHELSHSERESIVTGLMERVGVLDRHSKRVIKARELLMESQLSLLH